VSLNKKAELQISATREGQVVAVAKIS